MPGKIPKPEERTLDETGFSFVKKCIEVLESRGKYLINWLRLSPLATVQMTVKNLSVLKAMVVDIVFQKVC